MAQWVDIGGNPNLNFVPVPGDEPFPPPYIYGGAPPPPAVFLQPDYLAGPSPAVYYDAAPPPAVFYEAGPPPAVLYDHGGVIVPPGAALPVGIAGPPPPPPIYHQPPPPGRQPSRYWNPGHLPGGHNPQVQLQFGEGYPVINRFLGALPPWDPAFRTTAANYQACAFDEAWTVEHTMRSMLHGADPDGWALTEVLERGGGIWERGSTFKAGHVRSQQSLADVGWTGRRGRELPAVWVYLHRV